MVVHLVASDCSQLRATLPDSRDNWANWARSDTHPNSRETLAVAEAPRNHLANFDGNRSISVHQTLQNYCLVPHHCHGAPRKIPSGKSYSLTCASCPLSRSPSLSANGHCDSCDPSPRDSWTTVGACPGCPRDVVASRLHR